MPIIRKATRMLQVGDQLIGGSVLVTHDAEVAIDVSVAGNASNAQVNVGLNVAGCTLLFMLSDTDLTVEANNSSSPEATCNLLAGVPYMWDNSDSNDIPSWGDLRLTDVLTNDTLTSVYLTNGATAGRFRLYALRDVTP